MTLTILSVGYPFAPVSPDSVGGAEQVMRIVEEAIVGAGHRSLVLAAKGSRCLGSLFQIDVQQGPIENDVRRLTLKAYVDAIGDIVRRHEVDIVHMHGVDFASYLPPEGPALAVTLHLAPSTYPSEIFSLPRPRARYVCVSNWQMRTCPSVGVPLSLVPNGVVLEEFVPTPKKGSFALSLGRICPEKGFHLALDAAKRASATLLLAGTVFPYPEHERYFRDEIIPRLDERRMFIGAIGRSQKKDLMARASCVLLPSLVEETSSLVAMEALASGTPVIARKVGALAEILEDGRTGYFVSGVEEMASALNDVRAVSAQACRREAQERFSSRAMTQGYLELFGRLAAHA